MPGHQQVRQFVDEHVVRTQCGISRSRLGQPDRAVGRRARRPAGAHGGTQRTLAGSGPAVEVALDSSAARRASAASPDAPRRVPRAERPRDHLGDPARFLGGGEPGRDHDDDAAAVAVGRHGAAAPGAAPHLDRHVGVQAREASARPVRPRPRRDRRSAAPFGARGVGRRLLHGFEASQLHRRGPATAPIGPSTALPPVVHKCVHSVHVHFRVTRMSLDRRPVDVLPRQSGVVDNHRRPLAGRQAPRRERAARRCRPPR